MVAQAACKVAVIGTIDCAGTTKTKRRANRDGDKAGASDRTQSFDNGASIDATISRDARIHHGGLRLTQSAPSPRSIAVTNQGRVTSRKPGETLRIDGNGGAITYAGDGSVINRRKKGVALSVDNSGVGTASIATGDGPVTGGHGIVATTAGGGLSISTGTGHVAGTAGQGIKATTGTGDLTVTIGSGGVSGTHEEAINTKADGGNTTIIVNGTVESTGTSHNKKAPPAIFAHSGGAGNITVGGSGTVTSRTGRGIHAQEKDTATGGILITGTGATNGLGALCPGGHAGIARRHGATGCSAIRGVIKNAADSSDIVINRAGNIRATSAGINAINFGSGSIKITPGANAKIDAKEFGIEVESSGAGGVTVATTGAKSAIRTGGTGILAESFATAIPTAAVNRISVTTQGSVTSTGSRFDERNPRNLNGTLAAVTAGYLGGAKPTPNGAVTGAVTIANDGTLRALGGDGVQAFNFGSGTIAVTNNGGIVARTGITLLGTSTVAGTITNTGNIHGSTAAIDVTQAHATTIDQEAGTIKGDIRLSGTSDIVNVSGGAIEGRIIGNAAAYGADAGTINVGATLYRTGGTIDAANVDINGGTMVLADSVTVFGAVTDTATLQLKGSRTIDGAYVQKAGGTLAVPIGPGGGARLVVSKTADLSGTLTVTIDRGPGGHFVPSGRYTILTAGDGVTGSLTLAPIAGRAMPTPTLTTTANGVVLIFPERQSIFSFAATPNQAAAASALQALPANSLLGRAVLSQNAAGARSAFDALSGEMHASAVTATFEDTRFVREAILDRLQQAAAAPSDRGWTFWSRDFGDFGHNGGNGNAATLDRSLAGVVLGTDTQLANLPDWRVGVAGAYLNDSLSVASRGSTATMSSGQGAIYAGARYGAVDLRFGFGAGGSSIDTDRKVSFTGFTDADHAGYTDLIAQGFGEIGYRYSVGHAVIEPLLTGAAIHISQPGFREQGGAAALIGAGHANDLATTTVGVEGEMPVVADVPLVAHAFVGWRHAYGDVDPTALLSFAAGSLRFSVTGAPIDRDALAAHAGLDWRATSALTFGIAYSGQVGAHAQDEAVRGELEIAF